MKIYEVPEICQQFINQKRRTASANTIKSYSNDLKVIYEYICTTKNITEITIDVINSITIEDYYEFLDTNSTYGSRARRISTLKNFYNFLLSKKMLTNNFPIGEFTAGKKPERIPNYLIEDEIVMLKMVMLEGKYSPERNYCILIFFINLGIRLNELVNMNTEDIKGHTVRVIGKGDKQRELYLNDDCITALDNYLKVKPKTPNEKALFVSWHGQRYRDTAVEKMVKKHMVLAGIDEKKYHTHSFRHTCATQLLSQDQPINVIQKILGHSNISTTQIYANTKNSVVEKAMRGFLI